ncbi:SRPBCC domain-containing protein [Maribacter algicola]|uniref:SRPBCC domain-containing protein n=1 Tax=Meishania litoralis TaxID=3434685 RepID=A0ACC7LEV9_9FLAO
MENLSFDSFTKKIYIKTDVNTVYQCWATKSGIEKWFLREAEYTSSQGHLRNHNEPIEVGDSYIWRWHNWNGQEEGTILQANGTDFLEFSFASDICKVSVTLEQKDKSVLVTLMQYEMPTDEKTKMEIYNGCSCGWTFWLANLKAYLEHGILLNEKEFDLTDIPQAGHIYVNM